MSTLLQKIHTELLWAPAKIMIKKAFRILADWWAFFKTSTAFIFRKLGGFVVLLSTFITFLGIALAAFIPGWLRMINVCLVVTIFLLLPICFLVIVFICSFHPKLRTSFNKYVKYGEYSNETKLDNLEIKHNQLEGTVKNINIRLARHESIINRTQALPEGQHGKRDNEETKYIKGKTTKPKTRNK